MFKSDDQGTQSCVDRKNNRDSSLYLHLCCEYTTPRVVHVESLLVPLTIPGTKISTKLYVECVVNSLHNCTNSTRTVPCGIPEVYQQPSYSTSSYSSYFPQPHPSDVSSDIITEGMSCSSPTVYRCLFGCTLCP